MTDVQSIKMVAALLEDLQPVIEKHDLRMVLQVSNPQEPRLVLLHREHNSVVVCFREGGDALRHHRHPKGVEVVHHDFQNTDHHYLHGYDPESEQSIASAARILAIHISQIYDYILHFAPKEPT